MLTYLIPNPNKVVIMPKLVTQPFLHRKSHIEVKNKYKDDRFFFTSFQLY